MGLEAEHLNEPAGSEISPRDKKAQPNEEKDESLEEFVPFDLKQPVNRSPQEPCTDEACNKVRPKMNEFVCHFYLPPWYEMHAGSRAPRNRGLCSAPTHREHSEHGKRLVYTRLARQISDWKNQDQAQNWTLPNETPGTTYCGRVRQADTHLGIFT